jgi:hypothetical protein
MAERYQSAVQAKAADVPWRTRMLEILGFPADKVDQMEVERAQEQLTIDALIASTQPATPPQIPGITPAGIEEVTGAES